jgi:hypothetical protein
MSISHWGIFPGWLVPEHALARSSRAIWQPQHFDHWCAALDGSWVQGPHLHEGQA